MLVDANSKLALAGIERKLVRLRSRFDELIKAGKIRHCGCDQPGCPVHFFSPEAAQEMDKLRSRILSQFHQIYPQFTVRVGWMD
jgi:hypothetical protein